VPKEKIQLIRVVKN